VVTQRDPLPAVHLPVPGLGQPTTGKQQRQPTSRGLAWFLHPVSKTSPTSPTPHAAAWFAHHNGMSHAASGIMRPRDTCWSPGGCLLCHRCCCCCCHQVPSDTAAWRDQSTTRTGSTAAVSTAPAAPAAATTAAAPPPPARQPAPNPLVEVRAVLQQAPQLYGPGGKLATVGACQSPAVRRSLGALHACLCLASCSVVVCGAWCRAQRSRFSGGLRLHCPWGAACSRWFADLLCRQPCAV
jgi:hypothetical protein